MNSRRPKDIFDKFFYFLLFFALILALASYLLPIPPQVRQIISGYFILVYILFIFELIIRLYKSEDKKAYVVSNWIEFVIILCPFLGVLRLAPFLEETLIIGIDRLMKKFAHPRHIIVVNVIILMIIAIIIASSVILSLEKPFPQSHIKSFSDALWWSTVGVFTMGIGDEVPISPWGRALTLLLVLLGVISLSLITANIAAIFTEQDIKKDLDHELNEIETDLNKVEHDIKHETSQDDRVVEKKVEELERKIDELKTQK